MDSIDVKIVSVLHHNARISNKDIAKEIFLSSPATISRIEKLEQEKIITGYHADIDLDALGLPIVALFVFSLQHSAKQKFTAFISNEHHILSCESITGAYTHIIKAAFKSTKELKQFEDQLSGFGCTQTHIITEVLKSYSSVNFGKLLTGKF